MKRLAMRWAAPAVVLSAMLTAPAVGGESNTTIIRAPAGSTIIIRQAEPEVYVPREQTVVVTQPAPRVVYRSSPVIVPAPPVVVSHPPVVVHRRPVVVRRPWRWYHRHPSYVHGRYVGYPHSRLGLSFGFSWCD